MPLVPHCNTIPIFIEKFREEQEGRVCKNQDVHGPKMCQGMLVTSYPSSVPMPTSHPHKKQWHSPSPSAWLRCSEAEGAPHTEDSREGQRSAWLETLLTGFRCFRCFRNRQTFWLLILEISVLCSSKWALKRENFIFFCSESTVCALPSPRRWQH